MLYPPYMVITEFQEYALAATERIKGGTERSCSSFVVSLWKPLILLLQAVKVYKVCLILFLSKQNHPFIPKSSQRSATKQIILSSRHCKPLVSVLLSPSEVHGSKSSAV